jgi:hypothetical protein
MFIREKDLSINVANIEVVRKLPKGVEVVMVSGRAYQFQSARLIRKLRSAGRGRLVRFLLWLVRK